MGSKVAVRCRISRGQVFKSRRHGDVEAPEDALPLLTMSRQRQIEWLDEKLIGTVHQSQQVNVVVPQGGRTTVVCEFRIFFASMPPGWPCEALEKRSRP